MAIKKNKFIAISREKFEFFCQVDETGKPEYIRLEMINRFSGEKKRLGYLDNKNKKELILLRDFINGIIGKVS